jgi:hypothetical protein
VTVSWRDLVGGVVIIHADVGIGNGARAVREWDTLFLHHVTAARALYAQVTVVR